MMFKRNLVSVSIASVLLTSSLVASANTGTSEEEDSVGSWGQWAQNYATAAGGEFNLGALAFAASLQGETGRNRLNEAGFDTPTGDEPVAAVGCEAGAYCGFVTIGSNSPRPTDSRGGPGDVGILTAEFQPVFDGGEQGNARIQGDGGLYVMGSFSVEGNEGYELSVDGAEGSISRGSVNLHRYTGDSDSGMATKSRNPWLGLGTGHWYDNQYGEVYSYEGGSLFGGVTTSLDQLNSYIGSHGPVATYRGTTLDGGNFIARIDFSDNSWSGIWNGGADGQVGVNGKNVVGEVGFKVTKGSIDGINFSASSSELSAKDGAVKGSVNGALFGSSAQSVAGMVDIVKTTKNYSNKEHETLFQGVNTKLIQPR